MDTAKLGNIKLKVFWVLFLIMSVVCLILMIAGLASPLWVELEDSTYSLSFKGNLLELVETSATFSRWEEEPYSTVSDDWCDLKDQNAGNESEDFYAAGCTMFENLYLFGLMYLVFEILTLIFVVINIIAICLALKSTDIVWASLVAIVLANVFNMIGVLGFFGANNVVLTGGCNAFRNADDPSDLCAREGAFLAFIATLFIGLFGLCQCFFTCAYYSLKKSLGFPLSARNVGESELQSYKGVPVNDPKAPRGTEY